MTKNTKKRLANFRRFNSILNANRCTRAHKLQFLYHDLPRASSWINNDLPRICYASELWALQWWHRQGKPLLRPGPQNRISDIKVPTGRAYSAQAICWICLGYGTVMLNPKLPAQAICDLGVVRMETRQLKTAHYFYVVAGLWQGGLAHSQGLWGDSWISGTMPQLPLCPSSIFQDPWKAISLCIWTSCKSGLYMFIPPTGSNSVILC